jgi:DNA-binding transcriptional ArsR family regulator
MSRTIPEPNENDLAVALDAISSPRRLEIVAQLVATIRWQDKLLQQPEAASELSSSV